MMMFQKVFGISFISLVLLHYVSSSTITAYVGDTVHLECSLEELKPPADISWFIEWQNDTSNSTNELTCKKKKEQFVDGRFGDRGDYATYYEGGSVSFWSLYYAHLCEVVITNVTSKDSGTFRCVHHGLLRHVSDTVIYTAILMVSDRPSGLPKCSFSPSTSISSEITSGTNIQFTCYLKEEKLVLYQRYFDDTRLITRNLVQNLSNIAQNYTLRDIDNGSEFICKTASSKKECKMVPFEVLPRASITQLPRMPSIGSNVSLQCCGTAIPWVSRYRWFSNGEEVLTGNQLFVKLKANNCSVLLIPNVTRDDNNTQILCDVSNPNNVTVSAIAVLTLFPPSDITHTTSTATEVIPGTHSATFQGHNSEEIDKSSRSFVSPKPEHKSRGNDTAYIIISLIFIAIVFAITVLVFLICRKRESHSRQRNKRGNQSTNETLSLEQRMTTNTESPPESPMPRYQDYSTANLQHEDVLSGSRIDAVQSNAEGLTYASLDLNNCADPDEIMHPAADEAVMYADIKHQHSV